MLRTFTLALSLTAMYGVAAQNEPSPNTLSPEEKRAGWILLFDGVTMRGWVDPRLKTPPGDAWIAEDGCLKAQAKPRITEDLFTNRTFGDFELAFDWRISPAGNSGIKYRIQKVIFIPRETPGSKEKFETRVERMMQEPAKGRLEEGQDYVIGFEYQITDDSKNSDAQSDGKHTAGALYDMAGPSRQATRPVGEFNHSRIVLRGNHVEHWMNEVKVVDAALDSTAALEGIRTRWATAPHVLELLAGQPKKNCPISLQNHGNEAWFRNIKIRSLGPR